jgi:hypothetical protein
MVKTREYTTERREEYRAYKQRVLTGEDQGFAQLMKKLLHALSSEAFADENVIK